MFGLIHSVRRYALQGLHLITTPRMLSCSYFETACLLSRCAPLNPNVYIQNIRDMLEKINGENSLDEDLSNLFGISCTPISHQKLPAKLT